MMRALLMFVLLGVSNASFGALVSGHELLANSNECEKLSAGQDSAVAVRKCAKNRAYVMGVFDAASALHQRWEFKKRFCKPEDVGRSQLVATVRKYMNDHPEQLDYSGAGIVYDALTEAYSCE